MQSIEVEVKRLGGAFGGKEDQATVWAVMASVGAHRKRTEIFYQVAKAKGVVYDDQGLAYLLQEWYIKRGRKLRASHPRDICDQILDIANFMSLHPAMAPDLIDRAAGAYFVEL